MTTTVERLRKEVSQLPYDEREALVRVLELDLDLTPSDEVEAAWDKEIAGRISEIESGKAALVPYEQVEVEMDQFVAGLKEKAGDQSRQCMNP